jgi:polysaccharide biosynthesis transport protein
MTNVSGSFSEYRCVDRDLGLADRLRRLARAGTRVDMLQIDKSRSLAVPGRAASPEYASSAELLETAIGFIRRQYPVILFFALLAVGVAIAYLFIAPPRYTALAKLMIDTRKVQLFEQQSILGDFDSSAVDSQVEALRSENVALPIVKDLHLTEDPEFVESHGLVPTVMGFISDLFTSAAPAQPRSEFELTRSALGALQGNLKVKRVPGTYVIDIEYQSLDPVRAAQVANAVADTYILDQLEAKYRTTRRAATWLQDRLQELRGQASTAERAALDYKEKNNIVDTGTGGHLLDEQQLAEINSSIVQARAQTAEAKARLDRTQQVLSNGLDPVGADSTVTDTLHNDVINKLRQTYLDYKRRDAEWSVRFGVNHLAVVNLRNQMKEIRRSILDELGRINESYKSDYEIAKAREASVQKRLASIVTQSQATNQSQVALKELEATSQSYRKLYDSFLQRYMDTIQQQSFPITEARLITEASRPLGKSSPKSLLILAAAIMGGTILGAGVGILRDISDRVFRTRRQVEIELHTDCLAMLPFIKKRAGARGGSILRHIADYPFSRYAESIRAIKVAVDMAGLTKPNKVIGVTSSRPNEGKSTIAAALAEQMAHAGSRVILIDGDLRNGSLTRLLAPSASQGLVDIIAGKASFEDVRWSNESTSMTFLPAVIKIRVAHTSEMLASAATRRLFDQLRDSYDYVVVDLPPLAPVVDARVTTSLIDSYLFVVEWGCTRVDVVAHALSSAREIYDHLIGVVLNKADFSLLGRYDGARSEYYNRYGGHHDYVE